MLLFYKCQKYIFFVLKRSLVTFIILHGSCITYLTIKPVFTCIFDEVLMEARWGVLP